MKTFCVFTPNLNFVNTSFTKFMMLSIQDYFLEKFNIEVDVITHRSRTSNPLRFEYNLQHNPIKVYDYIIMFPSTMFFHGGYYEPRYSKRLEFLKENSSSTFLYLSDDSSFKYTNPLKMVYERFQTNPFKLWGDIQYYPSEEDYINFENSRKFYLLWSNSVEKTNKWMNLNLSDEQGINYDSVVYYTLNKLKDIQVDFKEPTEEREYDILVSYTHDDKYRRRRNRFKEILESNLTTLLYSKNKPRGVVVRNTTFEKLFPYSHIYEKSSKCYISPIISDESQFDSMLVWKYFDFIRSGVVPVIPNEYDTKRQLIPKELHHLLYYDNFNEIVERMDEIKNNITSIVSTMRQFINTRSVNFEKDNDYITFDEFILND